MPNSDVTVNTTFVDGQNTTVYVYVPATVYSNEIAINGYVPVQISIGGVEPDSTTLLSNLVSDSSLVSEPRKYSILCQLRFFAYPTQSVVAMQDISGSSELNINSILYQNENENNILKIYLN